MSNARIKLLTEVLTHDARGYHIKQSSIDVRKKYDTLVRLGLLTSRPVEYTSQYFPGNNTLTHRYEAYTLTEAGIKYLEETAIKPRVPKPYPLIFVDTKIAAVLRHLLDQPERWVAQNDLTRIYGQGRYGRTNLLHDISYFESEPWRNENSAGCQYLTCRGQGKKVYRWRLTESIEEYIALLTHKEREEAFTFCERLMTGEDTAKEGGRYPELLTTRDQWAIWARRLYHG